MNVITQIAITNKTDACLADIAEIADFVNKAALKMQYQELKKQMASLNMYQTRINVSVAEFVQDFVLAEFGKLNGVNKKLP